MLLDKLESGLLAYETEQGLFHAQASGWQRFHLLWTFRNFHSLPVKLLNPGEQRLVESLYRTKLTRLPNPNRDFVIGTVEQYKPTPVLEAVASRINIPAAIAPSLETKDKPEVKRSPKPSAIGSTKVGRVKRYFVFAGGAVCALITVFGWDHIQARPASAAAMAPSIEFVQQTSPAERVATPQPQLAKTQSTGNDVVPLPTAQGAVPAVPPAPAVASDEATKQSQLPAAPPRTLRTGFRGDSRTRREGSGGSQTHNRKQACACSSSCCRTRFIVTHSNFQIASQDRLSRLSGDKC